MTPTCAGAYVSGTLVSGSNLSGTLVAGAYLTGTLVACTGRTSSCQFQAEQAICGYTADMRWAARSARFLCISLILRISLIHVVSACLIHG